MTYVFILSAWSSICYTVSAAYDDVRTARFSKASPWSRLCHNSSSSTCTSPQTTNSFIFVTWKVGAKLWHDDVGSKRDGILLWKTRAFSKINCQWKCKDWDYTIGVNNCLISYFGMAFVMSAKPYIKIPYFVTDSIVST